MDHTVLCHLTGKSKMWPVSTWADPNPPCVPPPTLPGLGSPRAVAINLGTVLILLSVCQPVSAVARVAGNEWTCDKWSGA